MEGLVFSPLLLEKRAFQSPLSARGKIGVIAGMIDAYDVFRWVGYRFQLHHRSLSAGYLYN